MSVCSDASSRVVLITIGNLSILNLFRVEKFVAK